MKRLSILLLILVSATGSDAQKHFTKNGKISFYSGTSVEDIKATNRTVVAMLDSKTGELQFVVLMKGFAFKKALMQEHFNKDYVESDKYPRAEFKGVVENNSEIKYTGSNSYSARVTGNLTIHGQTKAVEVTGKIIIKDGTPHLSSIFHIQIADYKITVPRLYRDNISPTIRITVDCRLETTR